MKKYILNIIAIIALLVASLGSSYAQLIEGYLKDGLNRNPLSGVSIYIIGNASTTTDESGYYSFKNIIESGTTITVACFVESVSYTGASRTIVVAPGTNRVDFWLNAASDADGNSYSAVAIGSQIWMGENLKVTHFSGGAEIPNINVDDAWVGLFSPAYCWYGNNEETYKDTYGALYNWYTVETGTLCPTGWHVPTNAEWTTLTTILGGGTVAAGKLKESGTSHWNSPNTGATNQSGFTALPGGMRWFDVGSFNGLTSVGSWWSSTDSSTTYAYSRDLMYDNSYMGSSAPMKQGFSVRCINDVLLPTVTTSAVSNITPLYAQCSGDVSADGGSNVTDRGVCWSLSENPTIADNKKIDVIGYGTGSYTCNLSVLTPNTQYYVRAYATNSAGTAYGTQLSFTTTGSFAPINFNSGLTYGSITDIDGNIYKTIKIGSQEWMAENLKTTRYNEGTFIPEVTDPASWDNLTAPGYCWINNDPATAKAVFGALYNWFAVGTGNLCPTDWHVPSDEEWATLVAFSGGETVAGGALKELGTTHWAAPNTGASNETGFTALPGGCRQNNGLGQVVFQYVGNQGYWWSSTDHDIWSAGSQHLGYNFSGNPQGSYIYKRVGSSVRCVKNLNPTIVTNTSDVGPGSLRDAIEYANSTIGVKETITFNFPGTGPFIIQPLSPLPAITDAVIIDGFSQPGASASGSVLLIGLDGTKAGSGSNGLSVSTDNCTVKGLVISQFSGNGIQITSGSGNLISSNSIYSNGGLGIDLGSDGATPNDTGDGDTGPNNFQNFPVLESVSFSTGSVTINGSLNSEASKSYTIQFFASKLG